MGEKAGVHAISDFQLRLMEENELEDTQVLMNSDATWDLACDKLKLMQELFNCIYVAVNGAGEIAGTLTIVPAHDGEFVLGAFIVSEKYRGQGLGRQMLAELQQIYTGKVISLVSTPQAPGFYRKCGMFEMDPPMDIITMEVSSAEIESRLCHRGEILVKAYTTDDFEELCQYDRGVRGYDMSKYLSVMVGESHVFVARSKPCGNVTGYVAGCQEKSAVKLVIDGCYADNDDIALHLFWNILKVHPKKTNYVKLRTIKPRTFLTTLGKHSQSNKFGCLRFVNGRASPISLINLYAATDCDFAA